VGDGGAPAERVTQGWLRASHRAEDQALTTTMRPFHAHDAPASVRPGEIYELRVALLPMSFVVRAGERLRLDISNGDSPLTEGRLFQWYGLKSGTDTYHHSAVHASRLLLPEQPGAGDTPDPENPVSITRSEQ
jgi:predicted acyl esterase